MNHVIVKLKQGSQVVGTTTTDLNGNYSFSNISDGTYTLEPAVTKPWGGGNATDALIIMRYFTQILTLNGMKLQAADVNNSTYVNSVDALLVARRFTNLISSFPAGDWLCEKPTVLLNNSNELVNIKANAFGDVNGSYTPPSVKVQPGVEILQSGVQVYRRDEVVTIPVRLNAAMEVGAISLVLSYPAQAVEILGVELASQSDRNVIFNTADDELRIAWYDTDGASFEGNAAMLNIRMRITNPEAAGDIRFEALSGSEMADAGGYIDHVSLHMPKLVPSTENVSLSIYPNPFRSKTTFLINTIEEGRYELRIFDLLGHEVMVSESNELLPAGQHSIEFEAEGLPQGVYQYRLMLKSQSGDQLRTGKIVLER
jgi:hypothetical protein